MTIWSWTHSRAVVTPARGQLPSHRSPSSAWVTHSPAVALVTRFACVSVRYTKNTTRTSELQSFDLSALRYEWATCVNRLVTPASDWTIPQSLKLCIVFDGPPIPRPGRTHEKTAHSPPPPSLLTPNTLAPSRERDIQDYVAIAQAETNFGQLRWSLNTESRPPRSELH